MSLTKYRRKRDFSRTPEPKGAQGAASAGSRFVVQKHAARRLHYDFRLELDGVLKSWAVPKGPSLDPGVRALAVQVEDHPIAYGDFEGVIPPGEYGGGTVMLWDRGTWQPDGNARTALRRGKLRFTLDGEKLRGSWTLVQMGGKAREDGKNWLLIKRDDDEARTDDEYDLTAEMPRSVATGRTMEEIAEAADRAWSSRGGAAATSAASNNGAAGSGQSKPQGRERERAAAWDASRLTRARRRQQPDKFKPQLPTLVREPPAGDDWLHELKLDGYRILAVIADGRPRLLTRRGNDWTDRFPVVAEALNDLPLDEAILDGEITVLRKDGTTDFQALQNVLHSGRDEELVYFLFDVPHCGGYDLTKTPLAERKELLRQALATLPTEATIRFNDHIQGSGQEMLAHACQFALEGVVSKQADSSYQQRRSRSWVKVKCLKRQEFVIGGFSKPSGTRTHFGALLLGYHDDAQRIVYCGRVGTGFTQDSLAEVGAELEARRRKSCPFDVPPQRAEARDVHWVEPELIAEVRFADWTDDGRLRQASFQGLREDKRPQQVTREEPASLAGKDPKFNGEGQGVHGKQSRQTFASVRLSHPDRVLYPDQGLTKRDLAEYYTHVADWILPHVVGRPLTLVRCPRGRQAKCFFQKHMTESIAAPVRGIDVEEQGKTATYVAIDDLAGVITLVQLGALELHPWGSREDRLDRPDRIIFDLDPHEKVAWADVVTAAHQLRATLDGLGLASFVRTTGGKGFHVVAPIERRSSWSEVKQFAKDVADGLVRRHPEKYIAAASKAKRTGKIFVDYLRNSQGATAIASYSTRARAGATVATPIRWEELDEDLEPGEFTVQSVPARLVELPGDPWEEFWDVKQSLTKRARQQANKM